MERNGPTPAGPPSRNRRVVYALIVMVILPAIGAVAAAEMLIRLTSKAGYVTPEIMGKRSLQYVPALFARHVFPQREISVIDVDISGHPEFHINEKGYRGRDFPAAKPPGTIRIMIFGGSAVFDQNMTEGQDWPHRVQSILNHNGFPEVEVINAGIPGHASFDCFGRLFAEGHLFNPDYVLSYNAWNDIKYFRSDEPLLRHFRPYCVTDDPRVNYQGRVDRFLCEHSQLYVRLRDRYYSHALRLNVEGIMQQGDKSSQISETAVRQYAINQEMIVDLAREIGAVPILMTEARLASQNNTESERARIAYDYVGLTHEGLLKAYEAIEETLRRVSKEKNVDLIDVSRDMDGRDELFSDHVHLTARGSEELAGTTAEYLMKRLRARPSSKARR